MRLATRVLAALYALAAAGLIHCAMVSEQHHASGYGVFFTACALLFAVAIFHHAYHRDENHQLRAEIERAARTVDRQPLPPTVVLEDTIALELALACCERWWTSAGAEHDRVHCPRKDTSA